jgi:hypothetical protein
LKKGIDEDLPTSSSGFEFELYDIQTFASFSTTTFGAAANTLNELYKELQSSSASDTDSVILDFVDTQVAALPSSISKPSLPTTDPNAPVVGKN